MTVTILIADDEPDLEVLVRQRFRKQIRDKQYVFLFARNGAEALDVFQNDAEIEVVLTDINMPVMDGLTLLSKLLELNPLIQPVIVSAYGDMSNIRTAMNRGAFDFLTKPIDFHDFEITFTKALHHERMLKESAQNLEELAALRRELSIANTIQQSMLPRDYPQFPGSAPFDLAATMQPARIVGGDFYDYFMLDNQRLGFVIGDVSGKGVPAAIFMALCRTLLKAVALRGTLPGECLKEVNDFMCQDNHTEMFVTVFFGVLNLQTGELNYSNGGHDRPYVLSSHCEPQVLDDQRSGTVLGILEGVSYETCRTMLQPEDTIFLYTDGVTDAMDPRGELFSAKRLHGVLNGVSHSSAADVIRVVVGAVRDFVAGADQSDDMTALAMRYLGAS